MRTGLWARFSIRIPQKLLLESIIDAFMLQARYAGVDSPHQSPAEHGHSTCRRQSNAASSAPVGHVPSCLVLIRPDPSVLANCALGCKPLTFQHPWNQRAEVTGLPGAPDTG